MSDCCNKISNFATEVCDGLPYGAAMTAGSCAASAACGASAALVGVTAAPAALFGATAGVVFYVTLIAMTQITENDKIQVVVAAALAVIAGIFVTSAVLGVKVSIAAALLMSCPSAVTSFALLVLAQEAGKALESCCAEKQEYKPTRRGRKEYDGEASSCLSV